MCKVIWLVLTNYNALFHSRVITPLKISFIRLSAKSTSLNCFKKMKMIKREKLQWPLFCRYDIFCASMASFSASMASFLAQWPLFLHLWSLFWRSGLFFCLYGLFSATMSPTLSKQRGGFILITFTSGPSACINTFSARNRWRTKSAASRLGIRRPRSFTSSMPINIPIPRTSPIV